MKTTHISVLTVLAAGAIGLTACSAPAGHHAEGWTDPRNLESFRSDICAGVPFSPLSTPGLTSGQKEIRLMVEFNHGHISGARTAGLDVPSWYAGKTAVAQSNSPACAK